MKMAARRLGNTLGRWLEVFLFLPFFPPPTFVVATNSSNLYPSSYGGSFWWMVGFVGFAWRRTSGVGWGGQNGARPEPETGSAGQPITWAGRPTPLRASNVRALHMKVVHLFEPCNFLV
jgi:hypothetical protein